MERGIVVLDDLLFTGDAEHHVPCGAAGEADGGIAVRRRQRAQFPVIGPLSGGGDQVGPEGVLPVQIQQQGEAALHGGPGQGGFGVRRAVEGRQGAELSRGAEHLLTVHRAVPRQGGDLLTGQAFGPVEPRCAAQKLLPPAERIAAVPQPDGVLRRRGGLPAVILGVVAVLGLPLPGIVVAGICLPQVPGHGGDGHFLLHGDGLPRQPQRGLVGQGVGIGALQRRGVGAQDLKAAVQLLRDEGFAVRRGVLRRRDHHGGPVGEAGRFRRALVHPELRVQGAVLQAEVQAVRVVVPFQRAFQRKPLQFLRPAADAVGEGQADGGPAGVQPDGGRRHHGDGGGPQQGQPGQRAFDAFHGDSSFPQAGSARRMARSAHQILNASRPARTTASPAVRGGR